jgi:hypothetical protein
MNLKSNDNLDKWLGIIIVTGIFFVLMLFIVRPELVGSMAATVASIFTLGSVLVAYMTVREMRIERISRNQPFIFVEFQLRSNGCFYYSIKNLGAGLAKNILFEFSPSPVNSHGVPLQELPMFQSPIPILGPSAEICSLLDFGPNLLSNGTPVNFTVTVNYSDEAGHSLFNEYRIDISRWQESILPPASLTDYLKVISEQSKKIEEHSNSMKATFALLAKVHEEEILSQIRRKNILRKNIRRNGKRR